MSYAPVELRHVPLKRGLFGYRRGNVDAVLEDIASSYEIVWRQRAELGDRVEQLEAELSRHRDLEQLLRATLVSAEQAVQHLKEQAQAEARIVLQEARHEARDITRRARAQRESLLLDARRIRMLLHAALDAVDEAPTEDEETVIAPPPGVEAA
jgi:cell division initiation protein